MRFPFTKTSASIKSISFELFEKRYELPFAHFKGINSSKKIVITGGMDGDESSGILAAYELIKDFQMNPPNDEIIILPICNISGFEKSVSYNPDDGKYPKHIFPGKRNGSVSEQLIYNLTTRYLKDTAIWIDLHSGSLTESLHPFIWSYSTRFKHINKKVITALGNLDSELVLFDHVNSKKTIEIARSGIAYFILESGDSQTDISKNIERLKQWVYKIILTDFESNKFNSKISAYTKSSQYIALKDGIFFPKINVGDSVKKGTFLGEVRSILNESVQSIKAGSDGILLFQKNFVFCRRNEVLICMASEKKVMKNIS